MKNQINYNIVFKSILAIIGCFFIYIFFSAGVDGAIIFIKEYLYWPMLTVFRMTVFTPVFVVAIFIILVLERFIPVHLEQKILSIGFMHDSVWLVLGLLFEGIVVTVYTGWLKALTTTHMSFLTIESISHLPEIWLFLLGILVTDFLAWFQHWVKHKVPWFWYIHEVHHSQREINLFTDFRFHFIEYLISRVIVIVPLVALGISTPKIVIYTVFSTWFTRFYHANIKTNLGIVRYILVTPQSHRVHHSIEESHQDKNFGVIFSFWDRLFKTQCEDCSVYPETGIKDTDFPLEQETSLLSLIVTPLQQLIYPFFLMGEDINRKNLNSNERDLK